MMNHSQELTIGIVNPGAMGISVAATLINSGYSVSWASQGRSESSIGRANKFGLIDLDWPSELFRQSRVLVSICPPHAAESVANDAIEAGFQGLYLDANAIAPERARRIESSLHAAGIAFVDGSVIGGPAWEPGETWLFLAGSEAEKAADLFEAGPLETEVLGAEAGKASALKMCYAGYSKGMTALMNLVLAGSESLGVRDALERQWTRNRPDFVEETHLRVRRNTAKAWRFEGEMHEMVATFKSVGLPSGFHEAAAEINRRTAKFKDAPELPDLMDVLDALNSEDQGNR